ncbi:MAG: sulfatase-like hydrolase/transferase, partial [Terriglobales bacterium]
MLFLRLALIVTLTSAAAIAQRPPDIFLITLDTLRADRVGCYGYAKAQTPALDRLAREGVRFAHAFTPSPITNSSHTSILTGLNPSVHGVTDFGVPLGATHVTLAQVLKQRGYATAAFIGAVILDSNSLAPGLDRGFDFYFNFPEDLPKTAPRWG